MKLHQATIPQEAKTTVTEVARWAQALAHLHARIAPRFARPEPRRRALAYLQGLMSSIERKNGWQLAEHAREATPYGMQRLLSQAVWDVDLVRDDLRTYVYEQLGEKAAILVIDETSFPKEGEKSAGVQVQYCGTTGVVENCQVAAFLDYVTSRGHALIDRELYLPQPWIDDSQRCREAGIPETVRFQTKCELARQMVERVHRAQIPISWVVADTVYGSNLDLRTWLEAHGYQYVLAVTGDEPVGIRTSDRRRWQVEVREVEALKLHAQDWQRLSMSDGTKGPRLFDWACVPILHRWEDDGCHWLLIRRCINDPKQKTYYFVFALPGTTLQEMVKAIGARWRIEEDFETGKDMGLDQYEVRCWIGWYRHITLVMLAHAFLTSICAENSNTSVVDASTPSIPSTLSVVDASPPLPVPRMPPMIPTPKASPSLPALWAPPLPVPDLSSIPPALNAAPLTVPEVRHLLGHLIWPSACSAKLVLAWSGWRRRHRGMASYYHTKRRLEAG
jgi:SRSO17 transposase